jgi:uncharacterized protein YbjT (DUF2867 family)
MNNKKVVVAGATGSFGSKIVKELLVLVQKLRRWLEPQVTGVNLKNWA